MMEKKGKNGFIRVLIETSTFIRVLLGEKGISEETVATVLLFCIAYTCLTRIARNSGADAVWHSQS